MNRFYRLFWCFHCWLKASKYRFVYIVQKLDVSPIGRLQTKREVKQLFLKFIQSIPKPMVIIVCMYFKFSQLRGHVSVEFKFYWISDLMCLKFYNNFYWVVPQHQLVAFSRRIPVATYLFRVNKENIMREICFEKISHFFRGDKNEVAPFF